MMNLYTCEKCKDDFDDDDVVWANDRGQLSEGRNEFAWCVPCLPAQAQPCGDCFQPLGVCKHDQTGE